jgi:hypothetical protein
MSFHNIRSLIKYYIGDINQYLNFISIYLLGIFLSLFPVGWNGAVVTFFGFPLELYGNSREDSLVALLKEFSSWAWIIVAIFYLLPKLLQRLSESLSINNVLWLRFAPCLPYEIAIARVFLVVIWAFTVGVLGTVWALICAYFHNIPPSDLLVNVEGIASHILLAGGLVLAVNFDSPMEVLERNQIAFLALISPLILTLFYLGIDKLLDEKYMKFFPYTIPFNSGLTEGMTKI